MQNNELRIQFPVNNQHSTCNHNDKITNETNQMECQICSVDVFQNQKEQSLLDRPLSTNISNVQDNQNGNTQIINNDKKYTEDIKLDHDHNSDHDTEHDPDHEPGQVNQINCLIKNFSNQNKIYRDEDLDKISFSDDSEDKEDNTTTIDLDKNEYAKQSENIHLLYAPEEDGCESMNKYTGTKNETIEVKEIPVPFELTDNDNLAVIGIIESKVQGTLLVKPSETTMQGGVLDIDNIIFSNSRKAIGYLDDIIGNINIPLYVVKIFPDLDVSTVCHESDLLYFVKEKAKLVGINKLKETIGKGSDASNMFDEEVLDDEKDFSDDEEEHNRKALKKVCI